MHSHEEQSKSHAHMKEYFRTWGEIYKNMFSGVTMLTDHEIVLRHGKPYFYDASTFRASYQRQPKMCFMNAGNMAFENPNHIYVEGFVECHGVTIHHAWIATRKGKVIDPTIRYHDGILGYYGVPFRTKYLREVTSRYNLWGVMHHENTEIRSPDFPLTNIRT